MYVVVCCLASEDDASSKDRNVKQEKYYDGSSPSTGFTSRKPLSRRGFKEPLATSCRTEESAIQ